MGTLLSTKIRRKLMDGRKIWRITIGGSVQWVMDPAQDVQTVKNEYLAMMAEKVIVEEVKPGRLSKRDLAELDEKLLVEEFCRKVKETTGATEVGAIPVTKEQAEAIKKNLKDAAEVHPKFKDDEETV